MAVAKPKKVAKKDRWKGATWNPQRELWMEAFEPQGPYSETWPTSGMMRSGRLSPLPQSEHPTGGNAASSSPGLQAVLPTPRSQNGEERNSKVWKRPLDQPQNLENALARVPMVGGVTSEPGDPAAEGGASALTDADGAAGEGGAKYADAINRWEYVLGRQAPNPTEPNTKGNPRLSAAFSEWMMGWPAGWVTDVEGLSRSEQLKIVGNGVCPQQATAALRELLGVVLGQEVAAVEVDLPRESAEGQTLPPTPTANDEFPKNSPGEWPAGNGGVRDQVGDLQVAVRELEETPLLPTPMARDFKGPPSNGFGDPSLPKEALLLPTPKTTDYKRNNSPGELGRRSPALGAIVHELLLLPTLQACDTTHRSPEQQLAARNRRLGNGGHGFGPNLSDVVVNQIELGIPEPTTLGNITLTPLQEAFMKMNGQQKIELAGHLETLTQTLTSLSDAELEALPGALLTNLSEIIGFCDAVQE